MSKVSKEREKLIREVWDRWRNNRELERYAHQPSINLPINAPYQVYSRVPFDTRDKPAEIALRYEKRILPLVSGEKILEIVCEGVILESQFL